MDLERQVHVKFDHQADQNQQLISFFCFVFGEDCMRRKNDDLE